MTNSNKYSEAIAKILNEIKLGNSFLFVGVFSILIYFYCGYCSENSDPTSKLLGLQFGTITLVYGGIFRLLNIVFKNYKENDSSIKQLFRFFIWISILLTYLIYIDVIINNLNIIPNFTEFITINNLFLYLIILFFAIFIPILAMYIDFRINIKTEIEAIHRLMNKKNVIKTINELENKELKEPKSTVKKKNKMGRI